MRPAIQLYSLREFDEPLTMTLRRVAEAGFDGVEFANRVVDADAAEVAATLDKTGLVPFAAHVSYNDLTGPRLDELLETYETVGCDTLVIPHVSANRFRTENQVETLIEDLRDLQETLAERGFDLWYHNSHHEFDPPASGRTAAVLDSPKLKFPLSAVVDRLYRRSLDDVTIDETAYADLVRALAPVGVGFEVDTGHVTHAGYDPVAAVAAVSELGGDLRSVHVTDATVEAARERGLAPEDLVGRIDATADRHGGDWLVYEEDHPDSALGALERGRSLLIEGEDPATNERLRAARSDSDSRGD